MTQYRGNSQGEFEATAQSDLRAYDLLPPILRLALRISIFNFACQPVLQFYRDGTSANELVQKLNDAQRKLLS